MSLKFEIRKTGGDECQACGATDLVYSGGKPVTTDLTRILEREIVRREIGMAKLLRDHLEASRADMAEREDRLAAQFRSDLWQAKMDHADVMDDVAELLTAVKVDVSGWRLIRRRRERLFADRVDGVIQEMVKLTTRGNQ